MRQGFGRVLFWKTKLWTNFSDGTDSVMLAKSTGVPLVVTMGNLLKLTDRITHDLASGMGSRLNFIAHSELAENATHQWF